jgi:hypothetical protein
MVRRGSPVRVRKRALQKRRKSPFLAQVDVLQSQRAAGMEPFIKLSGFSGRTHTPGDADLPDGFPVSTDPREVMTWAIERWS